MKKYIVFVACYIIAGIIFGQVAGRLVKHQLVEGYGFDGFFYLFQILWSISVLLSLIICYFFSVYDSINRKRHFVWILINILVPGVGSLIYIFSFYATHVNIKKYILSFSFVLILVISLFVLGDKSREKRKQEYKIQNQFYNEINFSAICLNKTPVYDSIFKHNYQILELLPLTGNYKFSENVEGNTLILKSNHIEPGQKGIIELIVPIELAEKIIIEDTLVKEKKSFKVNVKRDQMEIDLEPLFIKEQDESPAIWSEVIKK